MRARAFSLRAPSSLTLALTPEKPGSLLGTREKFKFRQFPTRRRDGKLSFAPPCIGFITLGGWRENARARELVRLRAPKITMSDLSEILPSSYAVRRARARESERSVPARSLNSRSRPRAHLLARRLRHPALQRFYDYARERAPIFPASRKNRSLPLERPAAAPRDIRRCRKAAPPSITDGGAVQSHVPQRVVVPS
jgi:hypothetical protein